MKTITLVNLVGKFRTDLLKQLTAKSLELEANWLSSKVNYLDGYVSALIKVEVDESRVDDLKKIFKGYDEITASFFTSPPSKPDTRSSLKLMIDAKDRPGIVNDVTQLVNDRGAEIIMLDSHRICPAELGNVMFTADVTLSLPSELKEADLTRDLESLSEGMVVRVVS